MFFSQSSHNKCREPKAEFQRVRDRSNFCDYFTFNESKQGLPAGEKEDAMKRLNDLFKKS
jgi:hypothetical protein